MTDDTEGYSRAGDPETSREAARKIRVTKKERIVYNVLAETGVWMTSLCITRYLEEHGSRGDSQAWSVSPRLAPLWRKGLIERGVEKMTVLNSNNNRASLTAWRIRKPRVADERLDDTDAIAPAQQQ